MKDDIDILGTMVRIDDSDYIPEARAYTVYFHFRVPLGDFHAMFDHLGCKGGRNRRYSEAYILAETLELYLKGRRRHGVEARNRAFIKILQGESP